jgi:hypothetical protein
MFFKNSKRPFWPRRLFDNGWVPVDLPKKKKNKYYFRNIPGIW